MKLTRLRLHGFKSFADRTDVDFHTGITAIVGPNGCGKSNISDAIRWVLGEQRPTAIRGAKMEEAIFQGSVQRRPVNRGAVSMTLSNEDGALPVPFEEVAVGRTVYRDGGSEYSINQSACRLRDVHDLLRDTGLGANAYNVIENRMIDSILSDRADERRALFEEASGIGKYKDRRKAALRKLERAELDLERLEDVIAEVSTKVRSLARQKGKAERYHEYRARRLSVEVAVVRHQMDSLQSRLSEVEKALQGDVQTGEGMVAELRAAEADYEALRLRQVEAEKARGAAAGRLDEVRTELNRWERDLAVAQERAASAERRLEQIVSERQSLVESRDGAASQLADMATSQEAIRAQVEDSRSRVDAQSSVTDGLRSQLVSARQAVEAVEEQERDLGRKSAVLQGDAEAAEAQAAELERRLQRLQEEIETAASAVSDLESQGDLFSDRILLLQEAEETARSQVAEARAGLESARGALEAARRSELDAVDRAASLNTRLKALRAMEDRREGLEPAVQAALDLRDLGVVGALADFVAAPGELAEAVEAYLGSLARAVVVRDRKAAEAVMRWFRETWTGGGGLTLLPADRAPRADGEMPPELEARGEGAPWIRALFGGVSIVDDSGLAEGGATPRISRRGGSVDSMGIIRIGDPIGSSGLLARKDEIHSLASEVDSANEAAASATRSREAASQALQEAEGRVEAGRAAHLKAEDELRAAQAEAAAQGDLHSRARSHQEELTRQLEGTRAARTRALERATVSREDREGLLADEAGLAGQRSAARSALDQAQERWEAARAEESRLTIELTRQEGELARIEERVSDLEGRRAQAEERLASLDGEESLLRTQLEEARTVREEGASATETLFAQRQEAQEELDRRHDALRSVAEEVAEAERRVRRARAEEREASDRRHRLELERQELVGRIGRIEERLEGEWGRPLEVLMQEAEPVEGDPEELETELRDLVVKIEKLGPVNMLAVEEHEEESARLNFLQEQRDDLVEARDGLRKAIREINQTAITLFRESFDAIRANFKEVHHKLFQGGEADLWLEDEDDPLESPIEIHACPRGKKTQRIDLLSGGERALTALSLLFAIYLVKPSPFCVLDEVDGPLDENNIDRFIRLLQEFKDRTQFVVITHNPRTIEAADWIYGVTMEEPGVSTIVGVRLEEALESSAVPTP